MQTENPPIVTEAHAVQAPADGPPVVAPSAANTSVMVTVVVIPFLAVLAALVLLWNRAVGWQDLGILLAMYVPVALGVTVGYHRMLTHRAFGAPSWVRAIFLAFGSMAVEGGALAWAVDHRTHHAFSDREGDPHSPHAGRGDGVREAISGLWHAHMGWLFDSERKRMVEKYGKDLLQDRLVVFFERTFVLWAVLGFVLPAAAGWLLSGFELRGLLTGLLWGGLVRVFLNHHVTWSINSICHYFGTRPFRTTDLATNNWLLALPSLGESWHHNHHVFPTSAYHGLEKGQVDVSGWVIRGLEKAHLAWDVRRPSGEQLDRKRQP